MRHDSKIIALGAMLVLTSAFAQAQTIAEWSFTSAATPPDNTPAPSSGTGSATELGMANSYTYGGGEGPGSLAGSDVTSASGDSANSGFGWRVRGNSNTANSGAGMANGWNSQAPIGTQGAQFLVGTAGYQNINLTFDLDTTAQAEANLEVLYTLDGTTWNNATITSAGSGVNGGVVGTIKTGSASDTSTVDGSYLKMASGYNNQINVNLSAIPGANNDPTFGVEIVNASTGADDVNVAGAALNNSSGNWRFDNVIISGTAVPEPSVIALIGLALPVCWQMRRGRKS